MEEVNSLQSPHCDFTSVPENQAKSLTLIPVSSDLTIGTPYGVTPRC